MGEPQQLPHYQARTAITSSRVYGSSGVGCGCRYCIGKKKFCAGSVYMLPALVTLSPQTPSCVRANSRYNVKYSLQRRCQPFPLPTQIALINANPVLRTGSYRVDDTLGVATATPTISVTNAASRLLTTTPYSARKHCVRTRNPY